MATLLSHFQGRRERSRALTRTRVEGVIAGGGDREGGLNRREIRRAGMRRFLAFRSGKLHVAQRCWQA